ncbi:hypothetical protein TNIN_390711 [Trichonephila inaurata madagascariensis]|uniref:Uncharacterized protein n=1 Tax=Trichonephila inaurata madagascariensis TaxID=2747483 RepID=A0A8X6X4A9_9ARAC|nr:hypothetical protein TNIN_390711 [Trichonephila inaurata madagascariensis]
MTFACNAGTSLLMPKTEVQFNSDCACFPARHWIAFFKEESTGNERSSQAVTKGECSKWTSFVLDMLTSIVVVPFLLEATLLMIPL